MILTNQLKIKKSPITIIIKNRLALLLSDETPIDKASFFKQWFPCIKREHKEPTIVIKV